MATLKISDLSIGDWVDYCGRHYKVYSIEECGFIRAKCEDDYTSSHIGKNIDYLEPIPITAEILEKNGFSHNGNKWYTPELFTLERWSKGWSIVIACTCGDYVCEVCTIKYVHQLQRALRLAGFGKEINL